MDTLKIAPSSKAPRPSRARNPVGCLLRRPFVLPTLSPRNISRLIYFSAARGGPRERSRAVLFHEGNARVDKRKVMGYNSWGNLFAPERRRALGPIFIETFPSSHIEIPLPWTKAVFSYCAHPDTACLAMEKRFLRFPAILLRRTIGDGSRTEGWVTHEGCLWCLERYCCVAPHQVDGMFKRGFPLCGLSFDICWNDNWRGEKHVVLDTLSGKNFTHFLFLFHG